MYPLEFTKISTMIQFLFWFSVLTDLIWVFEVVLERLSLKHCTCTNKSLYFFPLFLPKRIWTLTMLQFLFLRITRMEERIRIFCFVKAKSQDWKRHVKQFVFHQQCLQLFWCIFDEIFSNLLSTIWKKTEVKQ